MIRVWQLDPGMAKTAILDPQGPISWIAAILLIALLLALLVLAVTLIRYVSTRTQMLRQENEKPPTPVNVSVSSTSFMPDHRTAAPVPPENPHAPPTPPVGTPRPRAGSNPPTGAIPTAGGNPPTGPVRRMRPAVNTAASNTDASNSPTSNGPPSKIPASKPE